MPTILEDYYSSFFKLHQRRQYTMGGPLPLQCVEIEAYGRMHGFSEDMRFFYRCVTEMDAEYFSIQAERSEQKKPEKPPRPAPKSS